MPIFMKIRQMGFELFHADGQKDKRRNRSDRANSHFSQFFESVQKLTSRLYKVAQ